VLFRFSMFNYELIQHGIRYSLIKDTRLLDQVTVGEAMVTDVMSVPPGATVDEAAELFEQTRHHGFPIADPDGTLHGILALQDIRRAVRNDMDDATVQEIGTHELIVAFPDETLNDAIRKMGLRDVGRLPVVSRENHTHMVGLVTRGSIINAYNRALIKRHTRLTDTVQPEHIE
jgi:CIC family chloride channel protein